MSTIDDLVHANEQFSAAPGEMAAKPRRRTAIVTCMDCRLNLLDPLGLHLGDAHVIRNAGGIPTDDVLRSLAISQRSLGTTEVALIHHTQCGMNGFDDAAFRAQLADESDETPGWDVPGFDDVADDTRRAVERVRACGWLPHRDGVRGFVYDVESARLTEV